MLLSLLSVVSLLDNMSTVAYYLMVSLLLLPLLLLLVTCLLLTLIISMIVTKYCYQFLLSVSILIKIDNKRITEL